jgi:hypothetical protein
VLPHHPDELEEDQEPYTADAASLPRFAVVRDAPDGAGELTAHLRPSAGRGARPDRLERLGRYEAHLDRKLERMLTILIRLQNLRRTADLSLPTGVFPAEPYAGGQGQHGGVRLELPRLPSLDLEHATVAFLAKGAKISASTRGSP